MDLTSNTIHDRSFKGALRGYNRDQVRTFLEAVSKHVSNLEEQLSIAAARAERSKKELDQLNDDLEQKVAEAKAARDTILDEAHREAASMREGVESSDPSTARTSAAIIAEAEAKASLRLERVDRIIAEAESEASHIRSRAEQDAATKLAEADRVLDKAKHDAREFRRELTRRSTVGTTDVVIDLTESEPSTHEASKAT